jgi:hypothetical protein
MNGMKFDSPIFDRIRVKPEEDRRPRPRVLACDIPGCAHEATHRAPKGRGREREYWCFCLEHVREYNASYNYFAGMSDEAVARYQKDAITGHRPTWKMGLGQKPAAGERVSSPFGTAGDPFGFFREAGTRQERPAEEARPVRNAERKALDTLGLEPPASKAEIKARFKLLVKQNHPDANGGDRSSEDRLREIIQAYNYLKSVKAV